MSDTIRLAISTCPNDTFAFHALLHGLVDPLGLKYEVQLLDIQQLNDGLQQSRFDVAKASFYAALMLADRYCVLPSGSALGFGVGPLLLAAREKTQPNSREQVTLCPGRDTTAHLLFQLFYPHTTRVEHVVFSDIMPRLQQGQADFGVCIHEGRFTWQQSGLTLIEDLGQRWERETSSPLPLGGLLASRQLDSQTLQRIQSTIRSSIEYGLAQPDATLPTMRKFAQEFDDSVLMKHVKLYVNDWTVELGSVGEQALMKLSQLARSRRIPGLSSSDLIIATGIA